MIFPLRLALKNMKSKPFRTFAMIALSALLALSVFGGSLVVASLRNGLDNYKARLGADVIVVPYEARVNGSFKDILLQGIVGNYYVPTAKINKAIEDVEGVEKVTTQFYLSSVTASCCSSKLQIVGFDPETDFVITPWISQRYSGAIEDYDMVVGSDVTLNASMTLTFFNVRCNIVAQLDKTDTGLDTAVYTNMNTIRAMAENSVSLGYLLGDTDVMHSVSAAMIKVAGGYDAEHVAGQLNSVKGLRADTSKGYISNVADGLGNVSAIIGAFAAVIWVLSAAVMIIAFVMISNERRREFAVIRAMGASGRMIHGVIRTEVLFVSIVGSLAGVLLGALVIVAFSELIKSALGMPYILPGALNMVILALAAVAAAVVAGLITAAISIKRVTGGEAGLMLREGA